MNILEFKEENLYRIGFYFTFLYALASFVSTALASIGVVGAAICFLLLFVIKKDYQSIFTDQQKKLLRATIIFFGCVLVTTFFSPKFIFSMNKSILLLKGFFPILMGMMFVKKRNQFIIIAIAISISILVVDIKAIYQLLLGQETRGFGSNRIYFATQLVAGIVFLFISAYIWGRKKVRYIFLLIGLISLGVLSYSSVRGAWVAFIFILILFLYYFRKIDKSACYVTLMLAVIFFGFLLNNQELLLRFKSIANHTTDSSNVERINMAKSTFLMLKDHPLFGVGLGLFQDNYLQGGKYVLEKARFFGFMHPHNSTLTFLAETGIIGTIGWLNFYFQILFGLRNNYTKSLELKYLTGLLIWVGLLISSLTDDIFGMSMYLRFAFFSIGISYANINQKNSEAEL